MKSQAPIDIDLTTQEGVREYIAIEALKQGVEARIPDDVVRCESQYKGTAVGDGGLAHGLAQFHEETFYRLQKKSGIDPQAGWHDYRAQIKILVWSVKNGHGGEWTCAVKLGYVIVS